MATVQTIVDRSLRLLGVTASGDSATTTEAADAIVALNAMLDSWRNERLMCYAMQDQSLTLSAATSSYTIGPSGTLNTTRPVSIEAAYIVSSNISYPVRLVDEEEYAAIAAKTSTSSWPNVAWYQPTMTTGTLYVYPVPTVTSTMHLITRIVVAAFSATTDPISLPPGWEEAMTTNLSLAIAPEYGVMPSQAVIKMATDSKANIKRQNSRPIKMTTELPLLVGSVRSNIINDSP